MFPRIQRMLSPSSASTGNSKDDDEASSYADTYFREIGFKVGDNSLLGSTESPDLDGEGLVQDDRYLGLREDNYFGTDAELAVATKATNSPTKKEKKTDTQEVPTKKKKKGGCSPFHSYFPQSQMPSVEAKSPHDSLRYSPASSYAISVRKQAEDDVSTLGEGSIASRKSPMWGQGEGLNQPSSSDEMPIHPGIQPSRTRSTVTKGSSYDVDDNEPQDNNAEHNKSRRSKESSSPAPSPSLDEESSNKWIIIFFVMIMAFFLLALAAAVLAVSVVQLKNKNDSDNSGDLSLVSTWAPKPRDWTQFPTHSPREQAPEELAREDLLQLLSRVSPDSLAVLGDESSPQFQAFAWLTADPEYPAFSVDRVVQRWVLATLYFSTLGDSWLSSQNNLSFASWLSEENECLWYSTDPEDVCDEEGHIVAIHLENSGLEGTIPLEVTLLSDSLERLYLPNNHLTGTIPFEFGLLTKLDRLQLTSNHIDGTIPSELALMSSLVVLGLGRNHISGTLPSQLGQLGFLTTLGLEGNEIEGTIPVEFSSMTSLEYASLQSNDLQGTIPAELGNISGLSSFLSHRNNLIGTMPLELCPNSSNITTLTTDCFEVECDCCTDCCLGCVDDGGKFVGVPPGTPTPSSTSLEPSPLPTGLFEKLRPALARQESPSSAPTPTVYPSAIPSDSPSLIPSGQPSLIPSSQPSFMPSLTPSGQPSLISSGQPSFMPSAAPSECIFEMSTDQSCYRKDEDTMVVSFHNCYAKPNDWVGLYSQLTLLLMQDVQFLQQEAELWVRTCGDQECTDEVTSGTVTFGEDGLRLRKAEYQAVLVRDGKAYAFSEAVIVSKNNCRR